MKRSIFFLLITVSIFGCAVRDKQTPRYKETDKVLPEKLEPYSVNGRLYYPVARGGGFVQEGMASWYGKGFHRKKTASGQIFNMWGKTAAHKTLPFGTYVRVEREIGLIGPGVTRVRLVALSKEVGKIKSGNTYRPLVEARHFRKGRFTIQVGAFENEGNARRLAKRLRVIFDNVTIMTCIRYSGKILYRVRVSTSKDLTEAGRIVKKLEYLGFSESFIVAL